MCRNGRLMGFYLFSYHRFEVNLRKQCEIARSQRKSDLLEGEAKRRAGRRVWLSQEVTHGLRKEVQNALLEVLGRFVGIQLGPDTANHGLAQAGG